MTRNAEFNEATIAGKKATSTDPFALESETGGSATGGAASEALNGYVAYQLPGDPVQRYNPANYTNLGAALQDAVDTAETNQGTQEQTPIYLPHWNPSGNEVTISQSVTFGANGNTFPQVPVGAQRGQDSYYIQVTGLGGSPALDLQDIRLDGVTMFGAQATGNGNNCEWIALNNVNSCTYTGGNLRAFCGPSTNSARGAIVLGSNSFNGRIHNVAFNGNTEAGVENDVTGMDCIWAGNPDATDPAGEWGISGCTMYAPGTSPIQNGVHVVESASNFRIIDNRFEGAGGTALVYFDSGTGIIQSNQIGRSENGADGINFQGFSVEVGRNKWSGTVAGDGVYIRSAHYHVAPQDFRGISGAVIDAGSAGSGQYGSLPNSTMLAEKYGTINYPGGGASNVYENDSTQL